MKTYLWALRHTKDELIQTVMGRHIDDYPASAASLEEAVSNMDFKHELRQTGLSMTDMYAIKEALNLIEKNDTERRSIEDGAGDNESPISNGHLPLQGDSEVLDKPVKKRTPRSRKSNKSQHDGGDPLLG